MTKFRIEKHFLKFIIILLSITTLFFSSIESFAYADIIAPIVSNLKISSTDVKPGDTLYASVDISDNEPLENTTGYFYFNYKNRYITIFLNYNNLTGKLEGSYLVPEDILNVTWEAENLHVYDVAKNRTEHDVTGLSFSVSGGVDPDITPPVVSNIVFSSNSVVPGDTLYVSADIEDESKMGSYATLNIKDPLLIQSQIEISLYYNSETDKLEGSYLITDGMSNGVWVGGWINIFDSFGNQSRIFSRIYAVKGGCPIHY